MVLLVAATEMELCGHAGLVCGVGPVEAAAAAARALAGDPPDAVLHVGLAGARGLEPGTVVVGTESVYCDLVAEWPVVDRVDPDPALVAAAIRALPGAVAHPVHTSGAVGGAVSHPVHTSGSVGGASSTVTQSPLVEAMEGFGVLRAATLAAVPAVEVRVVSNEIGEPDRTRWKTAQALEVLATTIPALLRTLEQGSG